MITVQKSAQYVKLAIEDGYKRLIQSSIEREIRKELTETAEEQAIHIFLRTYVICYYNLQ